MTAFVEQAVHYIWYIVEGHMCPPQSLVGEILTKYRSLFIRWPKLSFQSSGGFRRRGDCPTPFRLRSCM